jgi:hypothetical protein
MQITRLPALALLVPVVISTHLQTKTVGVHQKDMLKLCKHKGLSEFLSVAQKEEEKGEWRKRIIML